MLQSDSTTIVDFVRICKDLIDDVTRRINQLILKPTIDDDQIITPYNMLMLMIKSLK